MEKASYFRVTTFRENVQQVEIDPSQSNLCDTIPLEGNWTRSNPNCQDRISYKTITIPSDYITVRVDPLPAR